MNFKEILIIGFGGFLGAIGRFSISKYVDSRILGTFPYGTFIVNIVGCFLLALVYTLHEKNNQALHPYRLFLGIGFCGSFTTFSTFSFENFQLLQGQHYFTFAMNMGGSIVAGLIGVVAGIYLGKNV